MSSWIAVFDGTFWITMSGIVVGLVGLCLKLAYKSKCSKVKCCCLEIERATEDEERIDKIIANRSPDESNKNDNNL